jgi:hypothetical protein
MTEQNGIGAGQNVNEELSVLLSEIREMAARQEELAKIVTLIRSEISMLVHRQGLVEDLLKSIRRPLGPADEGPIYQCDSCGKKIQGEHVMMLKHDVDVAGSAPSDSIAHLCGDHCAHVYEQRAKMPF